MTFIETDELERLRQCHVKEIDSFLQIRAELKDEMHTNFNSRDIGACEKMMLYRMLKQMMN